MRYGFVIDQDRCIGCHACTVACKEEHNVPLGVFRTWVKYIEKGEFPNATRRFGVMRCNHCAEAPCVDICPTRALFHRRDGIVDFDNSRCIGCKACMQACPYDALYLDPATDTAAKCNFCAHRIEANLEPACVIVCPTQAIIAGDLDDPASRIARALEQGEAVVRKPHKGTAPKLFYLGIDPDVLEPGRARAGGEYLWSQRGGGQSAAIEAEVVQAAGAAREVYNVAHPAPWGEKIGAYLWTKSIAAGLMIVGAILMALTGGGALARLVAPIAALVFLFFTGALLIADLKRPERFYYLLIKPNPHSWLVLGAWIICVFGALTLAWTALGAADAAIPSVLIWVTAAFGVATAGYSGFLFAQARGRDLWQSPLFFAALIAQAIAAGAGAMTILGSIAGASDRAMNASAVLMLAGLAASVAIVVLEMAPPTASADIRQARDFLARGAMRARFWVLTLGVGMVVPIVVLCLALAAGSRAGYVCAAVLALFGVWSMEDLWVRAGQVAPLS